MSSYNKVFASFYDGLMTDSEFQKRANYILTLAKSEGFCGGVIVDLGCGTCALSGSIADKDSRLIGIDSSPDMLSIASERLAETGCSDFSLLCCNMQDFSLPNSADLCISTMDSINHITNSAEVQKVFSNAFKNLKQGGVFIFDVNTLYKHTAVLGENTFVFDEDDVYLVWDNEQYGDGVVRIILDFFVKNSDGSYSRYSEDFFERAYSLPDIEQMLKDAGFNAIKFYGDLSFGSPKKNAERVFFVCKKE